MKKTLILGFCFLTLTFIASNVSADGPLTLYNDSSHALGTVTLSGSGTQGINVTSPGNFPITISSVSSVTINGQTGYASGPDTLQLASGAWVIVNWVAEGIAVTDEDVIGRPQSGD